MSQTTDTWMEYSELRRAGFSPTEIQEWMRPQLEEAGFADQEINAHFRQQEIADGTQQVTTEADILDYLLYGVQNSNFGLAYRKELPSALTPEQLEKATLGQRMALQFAQLVMDAPVYAVGGSLGTAAGGPGGALAGAFAINAAVRAYYMERIAAGHTEDYNVLNGIAQVAKAVGNAGLTGIAVGKAGALAGAAASRLGPGYATAAKAGTEALSLPLVENALEGHVPHPQDFVDAAMLLCSLQGMTQLATHIPRLVPKLRHIYAATGKTPEEVVQAAQADPTIRQDLLSVNRGLPESFVSEAAEADAQARTEALPGARPEPPADVPPVTPAESRPDVRPEGEGVPGTPETRTEVPGEAAPETPRPDVTYTEASPPPLDEAAIADGTRRAAAEEAADIRYRRDSESTTDAVQRYERRKELVRPYTEQLEAAGYTREDAEAYGQVLAASAERLSEMREGMSPQEWLQERFAGYFNMTPEEFENLSREEQGQLWQADTPGTLFISEEAALRLDGVEGSQKRSDKIRQAKRLEKRQKSPEQIYQRTGARKDADGNWSIEEKTPEAKLAEDEETWAKHIDGLTSKPAGIDSTPILRQTPLVYHLLGADFSKLYVDEHLYDGLGIGAPKAGHHAHPEIDRETLKSLPRALMDPIAIFAYRDMSGNIVPKSYVVMLNLQRPSGGTVQTALRIKGYGNGKAVVNYLETAFEKTHIYSGKPNNLFFENLIRETDPNKTSLRFINTGLYNTWATLSNPLRHKPSGKVPLIPPLVLDATVKTEADLVKLKKQFPYLYQPGTSTPTARGGFTRMTDGRAIIGLFEKADASTVLHETSHFWLDEMRSALQDGAAPRWLHDAWGKLQQAYGFSGMAEDPARWVNVQERFARDFEAYCREGKAPSPELQSAFNKFKLWLTDIYRNIRSLMGQDRLSLEVRQVFDALLATEQKVQSSLRAP